MNGGALKSPNEIDTNAFSLKINDLQVLQFYRFY